MPGCREHVCGASDKPSRVSRNASNVVTEQEKFLFPSPAIRCCSSTSARNLVGDAGRASPPPCGLFCPSIASAEAAMSRRTHALPLLLLLALLVPCAALAAWPHDPANGNLPLAIATGFQGSTAQVSDGAGGTIVAWTDGRTDASGDIYIQRVSAAGVPQWTA